MADANKTASVFESLQLNYFSKEWVKSCWDDDFVDLSTLPNTDRDFLEENGYLTEQLTSAREILSLWLQANNENENGEGLWIILVESEISHKTLVAILAFLCHNSNKISCSFSERAAGVIAASVYLKLIALPGSAAFQIYNPELFLQACRLLNKWKKSGGQSTGKRKRNETNIKASQKSKKSKGGKQKRVSDEAQSHANTDDEHQGSEGEDEVLELDPDDIEKLDHLMNLLLQDVLLICEKYSLRQSESTAIQLVGVLLNLAKVDPESMLEAMGQWKRKCSSGILVYKAIYLLCQPFHGHVTVIVNELFREFLEHILILEDGKVFASLNRPLLLIRRHALDFVMHLAKEMGERCVQSLKILLQHICCKVPDRTEYRSHAAEAVIELLDCLPDLDFAQMLEWLKRLSKHKKVTQRGFAVDVILRLLELPERKLSDVPPDLSQFTNHKSMICTILSRCSDVNASVSSRALLGFSSCTNSKHNDIVRTIKEVITPVAEQARPTAKHFMPTPIMALARLTDTDCNDKVPTEESVENDDKENDTTEQTMRNSHTPSDRKNGKTPQGRVSAGYFGAIELTPGFNPYLPDTKGVVSMFHRRILESKVVVRKCAIQALQKVIQLEAPEYRDEDLDALQDRCADPALSVRKQAVQALSELLKAFPEDKRIQKAWVFGILPQVMDRETSVQEKCFDLLEEMILLNMKVATRNSSSGIEWDLLSIITDQNCEKLRRYLQKACQYWARTKKLKTSIVNAVQTHVEGPNSECAWMFLAEISKTPVKIDQELVINHWKKIPPISNDSPSTKWTNILSVLGATAKSIPSGAISDILEDLKQKLRNFSYPPSFISGMVNCVSQLHNCLEQEASQRQMQAWGEELMTDCDKYMSQVILNSDNGVGMQIDEEQMIKYMFTLGEVCQRCPTRMPKRVTLLIQSIIAAPCIGDSEHQDSSGSQTEGSCSQQGQSDSQDCNSQMTAPSSQASQPLSQFKGSKMSTRLRAHAFVTLGKMCLVDESLAKKTIAALARELEESDSPAIRNNVVIVMGDLTIRYTTLVDRYVTNMAVCLKDPSALVRKNTLTILTRLLQEEYIKWKGVLFFRYITTLLDETPEIKDLAEFCLEHLLLKKHPTMFFHPFIECIFHFNNYQTHPVYNKFTQSDKEKQKFTLAGANNDSRRRQLYMFMLEHMSDEQKFKVAAKTNKEILSAVVDKIIPLDDNGSLLLRDALAILSSKEIKLSTMRGRGAGDTDETTDVVQLVTETAKKALISHVIKRNVIENIVPAVISLKHILEKNRSPLLRDLMGYLQELMKDYKTEIKEVLSADKQLAEEIEFDLRNFVNRETEREARGTSEANTPRSNTPTMIGQKSLPGSPVLIVNPNPQEVLAVKQSAESASAGLPETETGSRQSSTLNPKISSSRPSLTILDAAKRAMTRVDQLRQTETAFSPVRSDKGSSSPASVKSSSGKNSRNSSLKSTTSQSSETTSPTQRNTQIRAISTPTAALSNITFATDGNITMLPPSPIPSVASARKGGKLCMSPNVKVQQKGKKHIIYMPHPEAVDPEPVKWNIQSPTAKRQDVTSSGDSTPSRKAHNKSQAGIRRSSRNRNLEEL